MSIDFFGNYSVRSNAVLKGFVVDFCNKTVMNIQSICKILSILSYLRLGNLAIFAKD